MASLELIDVLCREFRDEIEAHIYSKGSGMSSRSLLPCHLLCSTRSTCWLPSPERARGADLSFGVGAFKNEPIGRGIDLGMGGP